MQHEPNELLRKSLHIAFGLGALTLRWLPWWLAAAIAAAAVAGNWLLLHRIVGRSVARHERGWDAGIVIYPAMVCLLIVVFRDALWIAAVAWVILAFGDGVATIAGKTIRGPKLPWNGDKSWSGLLAFVAAAGSGALAIGVWMDAPKAPAILLAVVCAAIAESLPLGIDDNVSVPVAAATTLAAFPYPLALPWQPFEVSLPWLIANTVLAVVGYVVRSVSVSGAVGGWILGTIILLGAGWPMYAALLAFFVIGSATTKLGYRRKAAAGLAQEAGGRRSFSHAFANVGVAAICALAFSRYINLPISSELPAVIYVMGIAALATAAADTTASEVGQWIGRRAVLPLTFRRVPVGTEGAISIEGTVAGLVAAFAVAAIGVLSLDAIVP
ncbi:MAG TPA: DUF92 domain-containing protein, partial [Thermoanaerobaculia bacterium]